MSSASPPAAPPTVQQVRQLPLLYEVTVPQDWEDFNGHMSIAHYMGVHNDAGPAFFRRLGMDESYFFERRLGVMDLEHHLRYLAEVHAGDVVGVHSRLLARSAKAVHAIWFLVNQTRAALANTLEWISIHVDLDARRPVPFPADVAAALDRQLEQDAAVEWDPPVCGVIGLR